MKSDTHKETASRRAKKQIRSASISRLLGWYVFLFVLFFCVVFSPYWIYGKSFLRSVDGRSQYFPALLFFRQWIKTLLNNFLGGKFELPFWSMQVGFGQNTFLNVITLHYYSFLSVLFPNESLEWFLLFRSILGLFLSGLSFLLYGRTRVHNRTDLLLGSMIYVFSGFTIYFTARHTFFLEMTISLPLMLLGVDQITENKWSWLFIIVTALIGISSFYTLYMVTIAAVVYAVFHFFELPPEARSACGGFWRIFIRHVFQYFIGLLLAAVSLLPAILIFFSSSRTAVQTGQSLIHWNTDIYFSYVRGITDMTQIGSYGFIALPSAALIGVLYLLRSKDKRGRLFARQILLYGVVYLVPALVMVFSGFSGKTQRWCFIFSFWAALGTSYALTKLRKTSGQGFWHCILPFCVYVLLYLAVSLWTGQTASLSLALVFVGIAVIYFVLFSNWGKQNKRLGTAVLFAMLLLEITANAYQLFSPQYGNYIDSFVNAGSALELVHDNSADALEMVSDDSQFRTDVIVSPRSEKNLHLNYGLGNQINGVSSYYSYTNGRIVDYSLGLGNSQQANTFKIMDLNQRTALNELACVKYATAFENDLNRIPFGYDPAGARKKTLSDGSVVTEYLYKNRYSLPLSYAYDSYIPYEDYDALPSNRKEQAMLQGVVLESDVPLNKTALTFDDYELLTYEELLAEFKKASKRTGNLEVNDNSIIVKKKNYSITLPIEVVEGEIYLYFSGIHFQPINLSLEKANELKQNGAPRIDIMAEINNARKWKPNGSATITATSGSLYDDAEILRPTDQYYFGKRDLLMNLGYGETESKLKLTFSAIGEYSFDDMRLIVQPMDAYPQKIAPLQDYSASSVEISGNSVTVEYNLDKAVFACLAIPYSPDWSAAIDGIPAQVLPANGMYMGVMLPEGNHTIQYTYKMRGFDIGLIISTGTLLLLLVFAVHRRRKRQGLLSSSTSHARRSTQN